MKLTKEQVEHIAKLARLDLTENETEKYGKELSGILDYIGQLDEVDVEKTEPTAQVSGLTNALREDEAREWPADEREAALAQAPNFEDGQIRVKRILVES